MIAVRKPRLVEGSGRRYIDTMPVVGLVRPVTGLVVQLYGSCTAVTANSNFGAGGSFMPIRIRALLINSE